MAGEHPQFQTVEWWIEQLKEFNPKAVVHVAICPGDDRAMSSIYYDMDRDAIDNLKAVWIDVE
jgi:hypothetical protein